MDEEMTSNTKKLRDATKLLRDAEKIATETEDIGNIALLNLKGQRETLTKIKDTSENVDYELNSANKELRTIRNENIKTKAGLFGVGAILTGFIALLTIKTIKS